MTERRAVRIGLVQMTSGRDPQKNIEAASVLIEQAATDGAQFVATPETTNVIELKRKALLAATQREDDEPALEAFAALARKQGIWLLIGSLVVKVAEDRLANRSYLFDDKGEIAARYDKIHMFDVDLPGGERYRESKLYQPGDRAVTVETPWGRLGLSVCYDLRFPTLYRSLAQAGAEMITVPSAFTMQTGKAHWHTLLRARAIENGAYMIAPAQTGHHETGRDTFGHSLVVSPWGEVLADGGDAVGVTLADIDLAEVGTARQRIPSLEHDRAFSGARP